MERVKKKNNNDFGRSRPGHADLQYRMVKLRDSEFRRDNKTDPVLRRAPN